MKLYVCYGTWTKGRSVHRHPCGEAHEALANAGYHPRVIRARGLGFLPGLINNRLRHRREVKRLTGNYWVPVLVLDDRTVIQGSGDIAAWAQEHPAVVVGTPGSAVRMPAAEKILNPTADPVLDPSAGPGAERRPDPATGPPELVSLDEMRNLVTPEAIINGGKPDGAARPPLTAELLIRWEQHGALWRVADLGDGHVEVELCTCSGEPVDRLASDDRDVVEFVRRRPRQD